MKKGENFGRHGNTLEHNENKKKKETICTTMNVCRIRLKASWSKMKIKVEIINVARLTKKTYLKFNQTKSKRCVMQNKSKLGLKRFIQDVKKDRVIQKQKWRWYNEEMKLKNL